MAPPRAEPENAESTNITGRWSRSGAAGCNGHREQYSPLVRERGTKQGKTKQP
jgi:hypothetical protein